MHAFKLNDKSTTNYGKWFSDLVNLTATTSY